MTLEQRILIEGVYLDDKSSDGQFTGGVYTEVYLMPSGKEYRLVYDNGELIEITTDRKQHPAFESVFFETTVWSKHDI